MRVKYKITKSFKVIILQFIISTSIMLVTFVLKVDNDVKKWNSLIYPKVSIDSINLGGLTHNGAKEVINKGLSDMYKQDVSIIYNTKEYKIKISDLINLNLNNDDYIEKAFQYGKNLSTFEKYRIIKTGSKVNYELPYSINYKYMDTLIAELKKEIDIHPINASVKEVDGLKVHINDEVDGVAIDEQTLKKNIEGIKLSCGNRSIMAPTYVEKPLITKTVLQQIDTVVGSFSTSLKNSAPERTKNIEIASEKINGKLLMPGEVFSFNEVVGERTYERGFKDAPIIVGNKVESGLGGGICQVTSTLYNAVLRSGITPIERTNHSLPTSYVGLGFDATVVWGSIDFKFKNTLGFPLYIRSEVLNNYLTIELYSNKSLTDIKYIITSIVEKDNTLQVDIESTKGIPYSNINKKNNGYRVKVERQAYNGAQLIKREAISEDYYKPLIATNQ